MSLIAVLDENAHSTLDEKYKPLYVKNEKDNNFYLDLSADEAGKLAVNLQTEVEKLKKHNSIVLGEKDKVQEKVKAYEQLGKTPQEIAEFYKTNGNVDVETLKQNHKTELESVRASVKTEVDAKEAEVKASQDREKQAFDQLRAEMKQSAKASVMREFETTKLADDFLERRIAVVPETEGSNKFVVRVINDKGEVDYKAGQPKTPAQLLEETKANKEYAGMFSAPGGGGTGGTNRQQTYIGKQNLEGLSPTEKLKVARQNG